MCTAYQYQVPVRARLLFFFECRADEIPRPFFARQSTLARIARSYYYHPGLFFLAAKPYLNLFKSPGVASSSLFATRRNAICRTSSVMAEAQAQKTANNNNRSCLQEHMSRYPGDKYVEGWTSLWKNKKSDELLPWDRGFPNPALEDTLVQKRAVIGGPLLEQQQQQDGSQTTTTTRRKRALVPGCGSGYDVFLLASFGYDAYGLDLSPEAIEFGRQQEEAGNAADKYPIRDPAVGRGKVTFVQGDFFKDDWLEKLGLARNSFDLIYDYTVRP